MRKTIKKTDNKIIDINECSIIDSIKKISNNDFIKNNSLFYDELNQVIVRLEDKEFRIAVVGEFSSGKSTFINALIGQDLLKHGATETTAAITEIQNIVNTSNDSTFDALYSDGHKESDLPLTEIINYTSTSSTKLDVAKEILRIRVKAHIFDTDYPICFIDTPGLNGVADRHREITIEEVKKAHACIYLLELRGLSESDVSFIQFLSKYQKNFIFVQNFIDELNEFEGENSNEKIKQQKEILDTKVFEGCEEIDYTIVPFSARKALIARDLNINEEIEGELKEKSRDQLLRESRFYETFDEIKRLIDKNREGLLQKKDTLLVAKHILEQIKMMASGKQEQEQNEWEKSAQGKIRKNYNELIKVLTKSKNTYREKISNFVESQILDLSKQCRSVLTEKIEELQLKIKDEINSKKTIEQLLSYIKGDYLATDINTGVRAIEDYILEFLNNGFEKIIDNAILRITEYVGISARHTSKKFNSALIGTDNYMGKIEVAEEEDIRDSEKEVNEYGLLVKKNNTDMQSEKAKQNRLATEEIEIKEQKQQEKSDFYSKKMQLGPCPQSETKYEQKTHYEDRRGLHRVWQKFGLMGKREVTEIISYQDYSASENWQTKIVNLQNTYNSNLIRLDSQLTSINNKIRQSKDNEETLKINAASYEKQMRSAKQLLEAKKSYWEAEKQKATHEYLINLKKEIKEKSDSYFDEIRDRLLENFEKTLQKGKDSIESSVLTLFNTTFSERIENLQRLSSGINIDNYIKVNSDFVKELTKTLKITEELLCRM